MTILATLRQKQQTRARTVLGLLVVVWLNLTLQACATAVPATELSVDRPVESVVLEPTRTHSGHVPDEHCTHCVDCGHDRCIERSSCEGPVVASTKAETRLPDKFELESTVAVVVNDFDTAITFPNTPPVRPKCGVTAAPVPLTVQYCVYLI